MLVRCLYASRIHAEVNAAFMDAILETSRRNNAAADVTGLLCFTSDAPALARAPACYIAIPTKWS
jgi:hypothetical protein